MARFLTGPRWVGAMLAGVLGSVAAVGFVATPAAAAPRGVTAIPWGCDMWDYGHPIYTNFVRHYTSNDNWKGVASKVWVPSGASTAPCHQEVTVGVSFQAHGDQVYAGWFRGFRPGTSFISDACLKTFGGYYFDRPRAFAEYMPPGGDMPTRCVDLGTPSGGAYHEFKVRRDDPDSTFWAVYIDQVFKTRFGFGATVLGTPQFVGSLRTYDDATRSLTSNAGRYNHIQTLTSGGTWTKPVPRLGFTDADPDYQGYHYPVEGSNYIDECTRKVGGNCPGA